MQPHLIVCNYWNLPIGSPGCICKVVNKNDLPPTDPPEGSLKLVGTPSGCPSCGFTARYEEPRIDTILYGEAGAPIRYISQPLTCSHCKLTFLDHHDEARRAKAVDAYLRIQNVTDEFLDT